MQYDLLRAIRQLVLALTAHRTERCDQKTFAWTLATRFHSRLVGRASNFQYSILKIFLRRRRARSISIPTTQSVPVFVVPALASC